MTPVRLEPAALRSRVKHFTTEPLRSLKINFVLEANSAEPDEMLHNAAFYLEILHNAAFYLGLHCLPNKQ